MALGDLGLAARRSSGQLGPEQTAGSDEDGDDRRGELGWHPG
jgi:hypothetical protein